MARGFDMEEFPDEMLTDDSGCIPEEIDLSKPGWTIVVHFDRQNAAQEGTEAYQDRKILESLENLGFARARHDGEKNAVILTPLEGSDDCFDDLHYRLMRRYRITATAPEAARIASPQKSPRPRDSVTEMTEQIAAAMKAVPPVILERPVIGGGGPYRAESVTVNSKKPEKKSQTDVTIILPTAKDSLVLLEIFTVTGLKSVEAILARLEKIAGEERLDISIAEDDESGEYLINFSKRNGENYGKPMKPENLAFIRNFDYELS